MPLSCNGECNGECNGSDKGIAVRLSLGSETSMWLWQLDTGEVVELRNATGQQIQMRMQNRADIMDLLQGTINTTITLIPTTNGSERGLDAPRA